ncbi:MAG TPA: DUF4157 domain-containing protein, partial [Candidatus Kapabacteria bacterium]|nr:DUF4157 domain-containing protein [Candidatus Kapabacteria bacterium]
ADQIMRMPAPKGALATGHAPSVQRKITCPECPEKEEIQRKCSTCPDLDKEETVQLKSSTGKLYPVIENLQNQIQSLGGRGQILPQSTRTFFEPRFRRDFSNVRVHADEKASIAANLVQAKAFTTGKNVVFGAGQYNPGTNAGKQLLAHELMHVIQQSSGEIGISANNHLLQRDEADFCFLARLKKSPDPSGSAGCETLKEGLYYCGEKKANPSTNPADRNVVVEIFSL